MSFFNTVNTKTRGERDQQTHPARHPTRGYSRSFSQATESETSEATTATLRRSSSSENLTSMPLIQEQNGSKSPNPLSSDEMDLDDPIFPDSEDELDDKRPVIVATDFGTTFSSVAFARKGDRTPRVIANYPNDMMSLLVAPSKQVPTESLYRASKPRKRAKEASIVMKEEPDSETASDSEEDNFFSSLLESKEDAESDTVRGLDNEMLWGYGIQSLVTPDDSLAQYHQVSKAKLLLDTSPTTQSIRNDLQPILKKMKRKKFIKNDDDVISNYLTELFKHTKRELTHVHGIESSVPVEHVLCVPVVWSSKACRRMQSAMETAIKDSGLGSMDDLFLLSEPEAAATYFLGGANSQINPGEAFLILDCGGGTVDATTYKLDRGKPLRLSEEIVHPEGCLHGSSFLNEDYRKYLHKRLATEKDDIEKNNYTTKGIVDVAVIDFEKEMKRIFDVTDARTLSREIVVQGVRKDRQKGFRDNRVDIPHKDLVMLYKPHLEAIAGLMKSQLEKANKHDGNVKVKKVVLIGGFSSSPSLRRYLEYELSRLTKECGYRIRLIMQQEIQEPETAMAVGAVLRALDKEHGPKRVAKCSYGFLRDEPYSPEEYEAHARPIRAGIDPQDGYKYVKGTIDWVLQKGQVIAPDHKYTTTVIHTFPVTWRTLRCEEVLFVSDVKTESHWRRTHPKNKEAEQVGTIIADMSFLITEGHIQPIEAEPGYSQSRHWRVEFELVMTVNNRTLRYEARWPAGGAVLASGQTSIAAAFRPGTK